MGGESSIHRLSLPDTYPAEDRVLLQCLVDTDFNSVWRNVIEILDGGLRGPLGHLLRVPEEGRAALIRLLVLEERDRLTSLLLLVKLLPAGSPSHEALRRATYGTKTLLRSVPPPSRQCGDSIDPNTPRVLTAQWMDRLEFERSLGLRDRPKLEEHTM